MAHHFVVKILQLREPARARGRRREFRAVRFQERNQIPRAGRMGRIHQHRPRHAFVQHHGADAAGLRRDPRAALDGRPQRRFERRQRHQDLGVHVAAGQPDRPDLLHRNGRREDFGFGFHDRSSSLPFPRI